MSPSKGEGGHIGSSAGVDVGVTNSSSHESLEPVNGIPPNFPGYIINHWDKLKSCLGFGDLDFTFKVLVTGGFR